MASPRLLYSGVHPLCRYPPLSFVSALALASTSPLSAQRFLPTGVPPFELPLASPRASGFAGRIFHVSHDESRFDDATEADVNLGENLVLLQAGKGTRAWQLGLGVGVESRFSLTDPRSALISVDWNVGLDLRHHAGPFQLTLQAFHESSHLGDEYLEHFPGPRLDWTREVVMLWVDLPVGDLLLRGAYGHAVRDELSLRPGQFAAAIDYRAGTRALAGGHLVGGIVMEALEAADWGLSTSARLGIEWGTPITHRMSISAVFHTGNSSQRQFYLEKSRYVGGELRFDF